MKNIFYLTEDGNGRQSFVCDACCGRPGVEGDMDIGYDLYCAKSVFRTLLKPSMSLGVAHLFVKNITGHGYMNHNSYLSIFGIPPHYLLPVKERPKKCINSPKLANIS